MSSADQKMDIASIKIGSADQKWTLQVQKCALQIKNGLCRPKIGSAAVKTGIFSPEIIMYKYSSAINYPYFCFFYLNLCRAVLF
ncbi:hypothetical protein BZG02_15300 [Labilibaculum filiforme]|uniref:Uncharacterized protein n=1 Tax=Labilibaculum filiforme TaxID=1940526 RepID=A0A2N3HU11_9BACT|nr:hypothetical protein BZG02_15300 [Labilibaculum filiforme]